MNTTRLIALIGLGLLTAATLCAQPPRDGGGDRGGDRGRGGGDGYRGGPPGGGFGDRDGPPGGFRGGPPGGGFGGGPSDFLSRLDRNGNGTIDVDEQEGPAQFLIGRLNSIDPEIKAGQPVSIKKVTAAFEKMRAGGGGDRGSDRGRDEAAASAARDDALLPELLVPGFGRAEEPEPLMGFGPTAELLTVKVTPDDEREAAERMRRYDRNGDGFLTKDELSSRMSGNPMDFDRNRDGKLSASELAVRYARRREGEESVTKQKRDDDRRRDSKNDPPELPDVYNGRKSYRAQAPRKLPEGLPGFFTDKDANNDGQVTMAEFASQWSDELVDEFFKSDLNRDGVITASEARHAVEQGVSTPSSAMVAATTPLASSSGSTVADSSQPKETSQPTSIDGKPDPKLVTYAERIISRYDKNKDLALTASEWQSMLMNPAPADADRDGRVTINEYAMWMQLRSKR